MNDESSTFEIETKNNFDKIPSAISEMRASVENRLDKIEDRITKVEDRLDKVEAEFNEYKKFSEVQFEAIRQGLVKNYNPLGQFRFRNFSESFSNYSVKADLGELSERVYLLNKSNETALES